MRPSAPPCETLPPAEPDLSAPSAEPPSKSGWYWSGSNEHFGVARAEGFGLELAVLVLCGQTFAYWQLASNQALVSEIAVGEA